jgi:hypothetical protein
MTDVWLIALDRRNLTNSIFRKWRGGQCIRFLDGNRLNHSRENVRWVSIKAAIAHLTGHSAWTCNWDHQLTDAEHDLVYDPEWRSSVNWKGCVTLMQSWW